MTRAIVKILLITLMLASVLQAKDRYEKIIIGSYGSQKEADKKLKKLMSYLEKNEEIVRLQNEHDFYFIARQSGKYYITLIEPFSDKNVLKSVLRVVRKKHSGAFFNRVTKENLLKNAKLLQLQSSKEKVAQVVKADTTEKTAEERKKTTKKQTSGAKSDIVEKEINTPEIKETKHSTKVQEKQVEQKLVEKKPIKQKVTPRSAQVVVDAPKSKLHEEQEVDFSIDTENYNYYQLTAFAFLIIIFALLIYINYLRKFNKNLKDNFQRAHNQEILEEYEELDKKEMFLAKVSHELRTPMNAIIGLSHIVLESDLNTLQHSNVSKIKQSGEILLSIINDILDISKMEAGELKIENVKFDLNEVLEHTSSMVSLKAQNKGVELIYNIAKDVPSILLGDPLRVGQIFINILDNAIKFTKEGSIELSISKLDETSDSIVGLEFVFTDTGVGMSEESLNGIFKDFSQADNSTSRVYGGTGLGLSITKQLIEMMGGTIEVSSKEGEGTVFKVVIHFTIHEVDNKRYYRLPSKLLMDKNALIVDTNEKSVSSLTNMLTYFHYKVEAIKTLEEADALLSQVAFDLLIIDEQKLSKYSSAIIQLIKEKFDIKIILIESIYYQHSNNIRHLEEIDGYILKPFNQNSIFNVILEVYGDKEAKVEEKLKISKEDLSVYKNIQILIAEDNTINQRVIAGLLDGTGFELIIVDNGKEAVETLHKNPNVDLILMDINMNVMDGYEATKIIREYKEYEDIPIFALTANSLQKDIDIAIECGMQGYLTKPLNIDSLYEKLFTLFKESDKEGKVERLAPYIEEKVPTQHFELIDLDTDLGLKNSNNDIQLYKKLLGNFLEMYNDAGVVLRSIAKERRYQDGKHFIHDVKGLSLYLGGTKIFDIASKLEEKFEDKRLNENSILINKFNRDIELLLNDIEKFLKEN